MRLLLAILVLIPQSPGAGSPGSPPSRIFGRGTSEGSRSTPCLSSFAPLRGWRTGGQPSPGLRFAQAGEGWWDPAWRHRRRIAVRNNLAGDLKAGHPLQVEFDAGYLGVLDRAKGDLSDLTLVHGGRPAPFALLPGRSASHRILAFRTASDLAARGTDGGYALYFGNPDAAPSSATADAVFEFSEDFSRPETLARKFGIDREVTCAVEGGALVVRDVAPGRNETTPGRIVLKGLPAPGGFSLSFDLEIDSSNAAGVGFAVNVEMKEPAAADPAIGKRIDDLIDKLGDLDWEVREKSTKDLVRTGRPAVAKLAAASRSSDAEVRWRADHILREIRENAPSPVITAGIVTNDPQVGPIALASAVGRTRLKHRYGAGWPVRLSVTVTRDPDGEVEILWNNGRPQTGRLPGEVREISFALYKAAAAPLGTVRLDNIVLRRHVDDDAKPTTTLEVEETRP